MGMQGSPNGPESDVEPRRIDAVFEVLSHERRRAALRYLRQRPDGVASVDELAKAVADATGDVAGTGPSVERIMASLVHHHLPKLADTGLVEWDRESKAVRYAGDPLATTCLDAVAGVELD